MTTILVVDDEEPVRNFLALLLADDGYRILQAPNGAQAITMVEKERPDLVISDIMMPKVTGAELCRRLKASDDTRMIPVILMSTADRRLADMTGADAFIAKPFDITVIEALVQRLLGPREST